MQKTETGVTVVPIHFPESRSIQVHMSRVTPCPPKWSLVSIGWGQMIKSRKTPSWVERLLETGVNMESETTLDSTSEPAEEDEDIREQDRKIVEEKQSRDEDGTSKYNQE